MSGVGVKKAEKEKLMAVLAKSLAEFIGHFSYHIWSLESFRKLINFEAISQTEQDRIFNELEVTILGFAIFKSKLYGFGRFEKYLIKAFLDLYSSLGLEEKFIDQWKELITLRLSEYQENYDQALDYFKKEKPESVLVVTFAITSLKHIRRGEVADEDKLRELLQGSCATFDEELTRIFKKKEARELLKDPVH